MDVDNSTPHEFVCEITIENFPYAVLTEFLQEPQNAIRIHAWDEEDCWSGQLEGQELANLLESTDQSWEEFCTETHRAFTSGRPYAVTSERKSRAQKPVLTLSWSRSSGSDGGAVDLGSLVLSKITLSGEAAIRAMKLALKHSTKLTGKRKSLTESLEKEKGGFREALQNAKEIGPVRQAEYQKIVSVATLLVNSKADYVKDALSGDAPA
ncbi:hypothetical protein BV898_17489 [Hypsibius exemplaris]|uniref:XRCC4 N-terminal domain-containing protein n=1 Tax=Hypsibius exemplaris TaxID=2072580 RepID=A0A9X6NGY6_HYPEX|nr:hypothetical protein BV898_17489 [Hypsibius exemplaris]